MRIHLLLLTLLSLVPMGCPRTFDPALSGALSFSYAVQHGEAITRHSGIIPAEEASEILRQLIPREERHQNYLMQKTTEATLEYNGVETSVKWTRVKVADRMYIFKVRGSEYVLEEPHSMAFEKLLAKYGDEVPVQGKP